MDGFLLSVYVERGTSVLIPLVVGTSLEISRSVYLSPLKREHGSTTTCKVAHIIRETTSWIV